MVLWALQITNVWAFLKLNLLFSEFQFIFLKLFWGGLIWIKQINGWEVLVGGWGARRMTRWMQRSWRGFPGGERVLIIAGDSFRVTTSCPTSTELLCWGKEKRQVRLYYNEWGTKLGLRDSPEGTRGPQWSQISFFPTFSLSPFNSPLCLFQFISPVRSVLCVCETLHPPPCWSGPVPEPYGT